MGLCQSKNDEIQRNPGNKLPRRSSMQHAFVGKRTSLINALDFADVLEEYKNADPDNWSVRTLKFNGVIGGEYKKEQVAGKYIQDAEKYFAQNPSKYIAMVYPTEMLEYPKKNQQFTYIHRSGTEEFTPKDINPNGQLTLLMHQYHRLPPLKNNELPKSHKDKFTDDFRYQGKKIHNKNNKPLLPGRGMGCLDQPNLKIIGQVDPSDIQQGTVGDCWLLSGISTLAEYDGAVRRLFRKTKDFDLMPFSDKPNFYTITLWDLTTWKEVDIVVDERLCSRPNEKHPTDRFFGAKPSADGELWVAYLEKALVAHCGGWDAVDNGGQCTHAWSLLTGVKEQYVMQRQKNKKWACYAKFDPATKQWAKQDSNPSKGQQALWRTPWPQAGGGGSKELTEAELFERMCTWDDANFLMGCGSKGESDKNSTDGIVDNHAYGVVDCRNNVCGTGLNLIQVRNPWGFGEMKDGMFSDPSGRGWKKYPQIKRELKPVDNDPGLFWVTMEEFVTYFDAIYLSASSMTDFLKSSKNLVDTQSKIGSASSPRQTSKSSSSSSPIPKKPSKSSQQSRKPASSSSQQAPKPPSSAPQTPEPPSSSGSLMSGFLQSWDAKQKARRKEKRKGKLEEKKRRKKSK